MKTVEFETKIENGIIKIPESINKDIDLLFLKKYERQIK